MGLPTLNASKGSLMSRMALSNSAISSGVNSCVLTATVDLLQMLSPGKPCEYRLKSK